MGKDGGRRAKSKYRIRQVSDNILEISDNTDITLFWNSLFSQSHKAVKYFKLWKIRLRFQRMGDNILGDINCFFFPRFYEVLNTFWNRKILKQSGYDTLKKKKLFKLFRMKWRKKKDCFCLSIFDWSSSENRLYCVCKPQKSFNFLDCNSIFRTPHITFFWEDLQEDWSWR